MRVLLDENVDVRLRRELPGYDVAAVRYMGWLGKGNGELLALADEAFDVMITGIPFQQNLAGLRHLAVVVLVTPDNRIGTIRQLAPLILEALRTIRPRTLVEVRHPSMP